jgi:hypothetical protein
LHAVLVGTAAFGAEVVHDDGAGAELAAGAFCLGFLKHRPGGGRFGEKLGVAVDGAAADAVVALLAPGGLFAEGFGAGGAGVDGGVVGLAASEEPGEAGHVGEVVMPADAAGGAVAIFGGDGAALLAGVGGEVDLVAVGVEGFEEELGVDDRAADPAVLAVVAPAVDGDGVVADAAVGVTFAGVEVVVVVAVRVVVVAMRVTAAGQDLPIARCTALCGRERQSGCERHRDRGRRDAHAITISLGQRASEHVIGSATARKDFIDSESRVEALEDLNLSSPDRFRWKPLGFWIPGPRAGGRCCGG